MGVNPSLNLDAVETWLPGGWKMTPVIALAGCAIVGVVVPGVRICQTSTIAETLSPIEKPVLNHETPSRLSQHYG